MVFLLSILLLLSQKSVFLTYFGDLPVITPAASGAKRQVSVCLKLCSIFPGVNAVSRVIYGAYSKRLARGQLAASVLRCRLRYECQHRNIGTCPLIHPNCFWSRSRYLFYRNITLTLTLSEKQFG